VNAEFKVEVATDHFQLLFGDSVEAPRVDTSALWDFPGAVASLHGVPELVGLGIVRYGGNARVTVLIAASACASVSGWQELGRFKLRVPSGRLIFWGPEAESLSDAPSVQLPSGEYQGAALCRGAEAVVDEMAADGPDEYLLALWPASPAENRSAFSVGLSEH
jgi:hypothetical protein